MEVMVLGRKCGTWEVLEFMKLWPEMPLSQLMYELSNKWINTVEFKIVKIHILEEWRRK